MPPSEQLRIGLIGFGGWTRTAYLPAIRALPDITVTAVAGRTEATRSRAHEALGDGVAMFDDHRALLSSGYVDAVFAAVTEDQHETVIRDMIDSGLPLFYEPPLAGTPVGIRAAIPRLLAASQLAHADFELSYLPVIARGVEVVAGGEIGEPHTASTRMSSGWGPVKDASISLAMQLLPWYVDPLDRVLGKTPSRVLAQDGRGVPGRMQSQTLVQLDYDGVRATFDADIESLGELGAWIEVRGRGGDLTIDLFRGELHVRTRDNPAWRTEIVPAQEPRAGWPGMHESITAFVDAVRNGGDTISSAKTTARLLMAGLAAEEAIDSGGWVAIDPA